MRPEAGADRLHHLQIDAEQVVAAHAGFPRHSRGDNDDVSAGDRRVVARAGELRVEAFDRPRFGEIEGLALRNAVDDVEENDVAQLLGGRQEGQGPADLAGSDQSNFLARHRIPLFRPLLTLPHVTMPHGLSRFGASYSLIIRSDQAELLAQKGANRAP